MISLDIPGVGTVDFPEDMSDAEIQKAIETEILPQARANKEADDYWSGRRQEEESRPSWLGNVARGAGERGLEITGGLLRTIGQVAEEGGDWLEQRVPLGTLGSPGTPMTPEQIAADTNGLTGLADQLAATKLGYEPRTTFEDVKDSLWNIPGFAAEQGLRSIPDMVGVALNPFGYAAARAGEIGQMRAENDGRESATVADILAASPAAAASALLERYSTRGILGSLQGQGVRSMRDVPREMGRAALRETGTEAAQETSDYLGETLGTAKGSTLAEAGERALMGAVAGGPFGAGARGITASVQVWAANRQVEPTQENLELAAEQGDEDALAILRAAGMSEEQITGLSPGRAAAFVERINARRQAEAGREALDPIIPDTMPPPIEPDIRPGMQPWERREAVAAAREATEKRDREALAKRIENSSPRGAQRQARLEAARLEAEIERRRVEEEGLASGEIDPGAVSRRARPVVPEVIQLGDRQLGQRMNVGNAADPGLEQAVDIRGKTNLPVNIDPPYRPHTDEEVAHQQRVMARDALARQQKMRNQQAAAMAPKPAVVPGSPEASGPLIPAAPNQLYGSENRLVQTPDQAAEEQKAAEAFRLANERLRPRAGPDVRDTRAGGRPEGGVDSQQTIFMDQGYPVKVMEDRYDKTPDGKVIRVAKVRRYDPRTGQDEVAADGQPVEYEVPANQLTIGKYAADPRQAQDFEGAAEPPIVGSYTDPKTGKTVTPKAAGLRADDVLDLPTQTYRETPPDPTVAGAEGPTSGVPGQGPVPRSPRPEQGAGPSFDLGSDKQGANARGGTVGEEQARAEAARRQRMWEQAQRGQTQDEKTGEQTDHGRAKSRYAGQTKGYSGKPKGADADGWPYVDEDGFILSDQGGPIRFTPDDAGKSAMVTRLKELRTAYPDAGIVHALHPGPEKKSGNGSTPYWTLQALNPKPAKAQAEPEAEAAPEPQPEQPAGAPRALPGPAPAQEQEPDEEDTETVPEKDTETVPTNDDIMEAAAGDFEKLNAVVQAIAGKAGINNLTDDEKRQVLNTLRGKAPEKDTETVLEKDTETVPPADTPIRAELPEDARPEYDRLHAASKAALAEDGPDRLDKVKTARGQLRDFVDKTLAASFDPNAPEHAERTRTLNALADRHEAVGDTEGAAKLRDQAAKPPKVDLMGESRAEKLDYLDKLAKYAEERAAGDHTITQPARRGPAAPKLVDNIDGEIIGAEEGRSAENIAEGLKHVPAHIRKAATDKLNDLLRLRADRGYNGENEPPGHMKPYAINLIDTLRGNLQGAYNRYVKFLGAFKLGRKQVRYKDGKKELLYTAETVGRELKALQAEINKPLPTDAELTQDVSGWSVFQLDNHIKTYGERSEDGAAALAELRRRPGWGNRRPNEVIKERQKLIKQLKAKTPPANYAELEAQAADLEEDLARDPDWNSVRRNMDRRNGDLENMTPRQIAAMFRESAAEERARGDALKTKKAKEGSAELARSFDWQAERLENQIARATGTDPDPDEDTETVPENDTETVPEFTRRDIRDGSGREPGGRGAERGAPFRQEAPLSGENLIAAAEKALRGRKTVPKPKAIAKHFGVSERDAADALASIAARGDGVIRQVKPSRKEIAAQLKPLKDGEAPPAPKEPRYRLTPQSDKDMSLLEFLASKGGLARNGDLVAMDAHRKTIPQHGMLVRKPGGGGMSLDEARELAETEGYIGQGTDDYNTTTERDLLEAIDEELRGNRVMADRSTEEDFREQMERVASRLEIPFDEDTTDGELEAEIDERMALMADSMGDPESTDAIEDLIDGMLTEMGIDPDFDIPFGDERGSNERAGEGAREIGEAPGGNGRDDADGSGREAGDVQETGRSSAEGARSEAGLYSEGSPRRTPRVEQTDQGDQFVLPDELGDVSTSEKMRGKGRQKDAGGMFDTPASTAPEPRQIDLEEAIAAASITPIDPDAVPDPTNGKAIPADVKPEERLLLISCGIDKDKSPGMLPAIARYAGPRFQDIRKWLARNPGQAPKIVILSGKFNFIDGRQPIPDYDQAMTKDRASKLIRDGAGKNGALEVAKGPAGGYRDVMIVGGGEYNAPFNAAVTQLIQAGVIRPDAAVNRAKGGIGVQRQQMTRWLGKEGVPEGGTDEHLERLQDQVQVFASGMSAPQELSAGLQAWSGMETRGIGVEIGRLSNPGIETLAKAVVDQNAAVFVDSGAYGLGAAEMRGAGGLNDLLGALGPVKPKPLDFDEVLEKYNRIIERIAELNGTNGDGVRDMDADSDLSPEEAYRLYEDDRMGRGAQEARQLPLMVMPDIVRDQAGSLDLARRYREHIRKHIDLNVSRPIVPIQKGDLSLAEAYRELVDILGTDQFVVGIPAATKAISDAELREFLAEVRPARIHILGGASPATLNPKLKIMAEVGLEPEHLSADANILRGALWGQQEAGVDRKTAVREALIGKAGKELDRQVNGTETVPKNDTETVPKKGTQREVDGYIVVATGDPDKPWAGGSFIEKGPRAGWNPDTALGFGSTPEEAAEAVKTNRRRAAADQKKRTTEMDNIAGLAKRAGQGEAITADEARSVTRYGDGKISTIHGKGFLRAMGLTAGQADTVMDGLPTLDRSEGGAWLYDLKRIIEAGQKALGTETVPKSDTGIVAYAARAEKLKDRLRAAGQVETDPERTKAIEKSIERIDSHILRVRQGAVEAVEKSLSRQNLLPVDRYARDSYVSPDMNKLIGTDLYEFMEDGGDIVRAPKSRKRLSIFARLRSVEKPIEITPAEQAKADREWRADLEQLAPQVNSVADIRRVLKENVELGILDKGTADSISSILDRIPTQALKGVRLVVQSKIDPHESDILGNEPRASGEYVIYDAFPDLKVLIVNARRGSKSGVQTFLHENAHALFDMISTDAKAEARRIYDGLKISRQALHTVDYSKDQRFEEWFAESMADHYIGQARISGPKGSLMNRLDDLLSRLYKRIVDVFSGEKAQVAAFFDGLEYGLGRSPGSVNRRARNSTEPFSILTKPISMLVGEPKAWRLGAQELARNFNEAVANRGKRANRQNFAMSLLRAYAYSADGEFRSAIGRFDSPTMRLLADTFHPQAGSIQRLDPELAKKLDMKLASNATFDEAVTRKANIELQNLDRILSPFRDDPAAMDRIVSLVQEPGRRRGGPESDAASKIAMMLKGLHKYMTDAGVDVGTVKNGYFPREIDQNAVINDAAGFLDAATKAYKDSGLSSKDARQAAESWQTNILYGGDGSPARKGAGNQSSFVQSRVLTKRADQILAQYYQRDPDMILGSYIGRAVKRAEIAKRFGDNWKNWGAIEDQIRKEDPAAAGMFDHLRSYAATAAGVQQHNVNGLIRSGSSLIRTVTTLSLLEKSTFASIAEAITPVLRSGSARDFLPAISRTLNEFQRELRKMPPSLAAELAADVGAIAGSGVNSVMAARFAGGDPLSRGQARVLSAYFRRILLEQWTNATRISSTERAAVFLRRLSRDVAGLGLNEKSSRFYLQELGIDKAQIDDFAAFVNAFGDDLPTPAQLDKGGALGEAYRVALLRFDDQTIMRPTALTRPRWASHPIGAIAFQLQAFTYSFSKNVLLRSARLAKRAVTEEDLTAVDRALFMLPLMMLPALALTQFIVGDFRDWLFMDPERRAAETRAAKIEKAISRAGLTGPLDPYLQMVTGARYSKDPISVLTGPALGIFGQGLSAVVQKIGNDSPNTNASERKVVEALYDMLIEPGANILLGFAPGSLLATALTMGVLPAFRDEFVDMVAGERAGHKQQTVFGLSELVMGKQFKSKESSWAGG